MSDWAAGLLDADGVFCVLFAAMAHQVGAVDPAEKLCFCLEPLHRTCEPSTAKQKRLEMRDAVMVSTSAGLLRSWYTKVFDKKLRIFVDFCKNNNNS